MSCIRTVLMFVPKWCRHSCRPWTSISTVTCH